MTTHRFQVGVKAPFVCRHFLIGDFGPETVPHSHDYVVEWILEASGLDLNGFACDIALMEKIVRQTLDDLEDRLLNELPFFRDRQPSVENTAIFLELTFSQGLFSALGECSRLLSSLVRVWENQNAWASYRRDFPQQGSE